MTQKGIIKNTTTAEISASDFAAVFNALVGKSGIVNGFDNLACTKVSDNSVQIASGVYSLSGYLLHVEAGTVASIAIDSGTTGQKRNDLIVAELVKNGGGGGVDTLQFRVVKGTSTSGIPVDPTLIQQDVNASGITRQEVLCRVSLDGITITSVTMLAECIGNLASGVIESGGTNATGFYKKYADGTLEVYGRKAVFLNIATNYGYLYRTQTPITITYPAGAVFDLTNCTPSVNVTAKDALVQTYGDSTPTECYVYGIKPQAVTNQSVTFEYNVKGRWKD